MDNDLKKRIVVCSLVTASALTHCEDRPPDGAFVFMFRRWTPTLSPAAEE